MLHHLEYLIDRFDARPAHRSDAPGEHLAIAIRRAVPADAPLLREIAGLDSAKPLEGAVLVAVVEGRLWAAIGLDDDRVVADPYRPTAPATELLRLRVRQLRAADGRPRRGVLPRWIAGRARA